MGNKEESEEEGVGVPKTTPGFGDLLEGLNRAQHTVRLTTTVYYRRGRRTNQQQQKGAGRSPRGTGRASERPAPAEPHGTCWTPPRPNTRDDTHGTPPASATPWDSVPGASQGLMVRAPSSAYQNPTLRRKAGVQSESHGCRNSLGTVNCPYQLGNGADAPKIQVPSLSVKVRPYKQAFLRIIILFCIRNILKYSYFLTEEYCFQEFFSAV